MNFISTLLVVPIEYINSGALSLSKEQIKRTLSI